MERSKNDIWVGLFVLLGFFAVLFLALQSANLLHLNFQTGYRVTARFDNIGGGPDFNRWPLSHEGKSLYWEGLNKSKKSVAIDLG